MALNVAQLIATVGYQTQGVQETVNAAKQVTNAVKGNQEAVALQQAEVARLTREYERHVDALNKATSVFAGYGKTAQQVRAEAAIVTAEIEKLSGQLLDLYRLNAEGKISNEEFNASFEKLSGTLTKLQEDNKATLESFELLGAIDEIGEKTLRVQRSLEREQDRLNDVMEGSASKYELSRTSLNGLIGLLRTGRVNTALLGEVFSRFSGKLIQMASSAAAAITPVTAVIGALIAAPFIAIAGGIGLINSRFGEMAQQASLVPAQVRAVVNSLGDLEGVDLFGTAQAVVSGRNRSASFGAENAGAAAAATARIAEQAQFLDADPGDFAETFDQIQRSIERLDFSQLRDLGLPVSELNAEMKRLANEGLSEAERRSAALAIIQTDLANKISQTAAQANAEANTWQGFMAEIGEAFQSVFASAGIEKSVDAFMSNLRRTLPFFRGLAKVIGVAFKGALDISNFFLSGLIKVVNGVITAFEFLVNQLIKAGQFVGLFEDEELRNYQRMEETVIDLSGGLGDLGDAFAGMEDGADSAQAAVDRVQEAMDRLRNQVSGGQSVVQGIVAAGDALADFDEFGDPQALFGVIGAMENLQDLALQGVDLSVLQNDLLRLRNVGILSADQYRQAVEQIAAADQIFQPFVDEAEDLERTVSEQEGVFRQAQNNLSGTGQVAVDAGGQVRQFGSDWADTANFIANNPIQGQINITTGFSGGSFVGGGGGAGFTPRGSGSSAGETEVQTRAAAQAARADRLSLKESIEDTNAAVKGSNQNIQGAIADFAAAFRSPARSGGGGGGGGGTEDTGATLEEIRELINQVNSAISIASRGGVRIGTGGNVIPFEEGSFLDSRGGDLNISTIQIRGIWDFADPEAKRQILRELEEALEELKAEAI